jgi:biotin carboxylase
MSQLPLLAVVHDRGSASPMEVVAAARRLCDVVFVCDERLPGSAGAAAQIARFARVCDVTGLDGDGTRAAVAALGAAGIVTFSEYRIPRTADLAAHCGLPYHRDGTVRRLVDKRAQRAALHAAGVESTRCVTVHGPADVPAAVAATGLPAVLKPRSGAGSVDTCRVETAEQAQAALREFTAGQGGSAPAGFVLEELLTGDPLAAGEGFGDYVSVESVVHDGTVHHLCVTGKLPLAEPFRETGMVLPAPLPGPLAARVEALAGAAVAALGIEHGLTHVEIKLTPGGPRLIEVNGRLGGFVAALLRRAAGYDPVRAALRAALRLEPEVPRFAFREVSFQYYLTPPAGPARLVAIHGLDAVRAMDEVWQVAVTAEPGSEVGWRQGTMGMLGVVHGAAPDHAGVRAAVKAIREKIAVEYA